MSLINDALKRAKEAQQQAQPNPPGGPPLRPVEHRPARDHSVWMMLLFAVVVATASILLWQWFQQSRPPKSQTLASQASTSGQSQAAPVALPPTPPVTPVVASLAAPPTTQSVPAKDVGRPAVDPPKPEAAALSTTNVLAPTNGPATAPPAAVPRAPAVETTPPPGPLKLQGILFHPTRPSAVVNGKLLFVGDRLGELRVMAIEQESVTLVGGGRTNLLLLK
jgi:cytoskeletal protein RodZ